MSNATGPTTKETEEAKSLQLRLAAKGILAIWGGGRRSKGHGFWLYRAGPETFARFEATRGWTHLDDAPIIENDGKASGNPCFTMFADAMRLTE